MSDHTTATPQNYTDKDMQIISELAYVTFSDSMLEMSFSEIMNDEVLRAEFTKQFMKGLENPEPGTAEEAAYNWKCSVLELLKNDEKYSNWKLVDIKDLNAEKGMYAIVVETDEDSAIVAFRGSENCFTQHEDKLSASFYFVIMDKPSAYTVTGGNIYKMHEFEAA